MMYQGARPAKSPTKQAKQKIEVFTAGFMAAFWQAMTSIEEVKLCLIEINSFQEINAVFLKR